MSKFLDFRGQLVGTLFALCFSLASATHPRHFHLEVSARGAIQPKIPSPSLSSLVRVEGSRRRKSKQERQQRRQQRRQRIQEIFKKVTRQFGHQGKRPGKITVDSDDSDRRSSVPSLQFPARCRNGVVELRGAYYVSAAKKFRRPSCTVRGVDGARVQLLSDSELVFDKVVFEGDITFERIRQGFKICHKPLVRANLVQISDSSAWVRFYECQGTGLRTQDLQQSDGRLDFFKCGGGNWSALESENMSQTGGVLTFEQCTCTECHGGGAHVSRSVKHTGGEMIFADCSAQRGGGMHANALNSTQGVLAFRNCNATESGGCLAASGSLRLTRAETGQVLFQKCESGLAGGAIHAREMKQVLVSGDVHFEDCTSGFKVGGVISAFDNVEDKLNWTALEGYIRCPLGSYHAPEAENKSIGCRRCELGKLRVNATSTKCEPCPDNAQVCLPAELQMQPGFMVRDIHEPTLNETRRCPNPLACHGTAPGKMCEDGYFGEGCAQCAESHALSDASVLVCVQCAESSVARAFQVLAWLGKSALVFGIASKSVLGSTGTAKASSIYLNQLLSFSTVASTVMSAMLQTPAAQELQETVARFLFQAASLIMDVGSGQDVGGGGQSVQCILQYIGLQPSVWKGQVAFAAAVTMFTALLAAAKGPRVAVLVSINCFFPAFLGHFGRQLVCFRLGETEGLEGLHCPHVPSFPGGFALVLAVTVLTAAVILRVWWSLYGGVAVEEAKKEESEEAKIPLHVAFLTAPYHEAYAKWETERLLRKTTFTLLAAMLPVSASPSLQMSSLGLLLLGSLVMYMLCLPYKNERWNQAEVALLTVSLAMIFAIVALLARDLHWGQSDIVQVIVILFVTMIAAGTCGFLAFLTVRNLVLEHSAALPKSSSGTTRRRSGAPPPPKPRGSSAALSQIQSPALVPKPEIHVSHAHEPPATLPEFPPSIAAPATGQGPVQAPGKPADLPPGIGVSDVHTGPATLPESDPGMVVPDLQATPATLASRPGPGAQVPL